VIVSSSSSFPLSRFNTLAYVYHLTLHPHFHAQHLLHNSVHHRVHHAAEEGVHHTAAVEEEEAHHTAEEVHHTAAVEEEEAHHTAEEELHRTPGAGGEELHNLLHLPARSSDQGTAVVPAASMHMDPTVEA